VYAMEAATAGRCGLTLHVGRQPITGIKGARGLASVTAGFTWHTDNHLVSLDAETGRNLERRSAEFLRSLCKLRRRRCW